jgi:uncharacterized protein (DUF2147 family)
MRAPAGLIGLMAALLGAPALANPAAAPPSLDGFWIDSDGEVVLQVLPCGQARCAHVAWLKQPNGADGKPLLDFKNPDAGKRSKPVCGMRVINGFKPQQANVWGGGTVYVPDQGMSFSGYAEVLSPTQIKVTGYVALPIFGSSEVWSRVSAPAGHCPPTQ